MSEEPIKVILVSNEVFPYHGYGGAQRFVYTLAKHLIKKGVKATIITKTTGGRRLKIYKYDNIKYILIPELLPKKFKIISNNLYQRDWNDQSLTTLLLKKIPIIRGIMTTLNDFIWMKKVSDYLDTVDCDIIHSFSSTSLWYQFKKNHKPVLVQLWDIGKRGLSYKSVLKFRKKTDAENIKLTHLINISDHIVTCGPDYTRELIDIFNVSKNKLLYIPNGTENKIISQNNDQNRAQLRELLKLKIDDFILISVNRLEPDKRVDIIINVFEALKKHITNAKLIIIGTGSLENNVLRMIKLSKYKDSIIHYKNISENKLHQLLLMADLFINTATTRYMLLTVMEAMTCKLPIISTTPLDDIVINGQNGYVFETIDPIVLANKIIKMLSEDNIKKMGICSSKIIDNYTWEEVAKKATEAYEKILRNEKQSYIM